MIDAFKTTLNETFKFWRFIGGAIVSEIRSLLDGWRSFKYLTKFEIENIKNEFEDKAFSINLTSITLNQAL